MIAKQARLEKMLHYRIIKRAEWQKLMKWRNPDNTHRNLLLDCGRILPIPRHCGRRSWAPRAYNRRRSSVKNSARTPMRRCFKVTQKKVKIPSPCGWGLKDGL